MRALFLGPVLRLVPVGLLALAVQRVIAAEHPIADVKLQVVLALVVAAGVGGGADRGAVAGFVLGLLFDLSGDTPLGVMGLAYGLAGMTAGYVHTITPDPQWWLMMLFGAAGAAVGEASVPGFELIAGGQDWQGAGLWREVPIVALAAGLVCPLMVPLGRWAMGVRARKWKVIAE